MNTEEGLKFYKRRHQQKWFGILTKDIIVERLRPGEEHATEWIFNRFINPKCWRLWLTKDRVLLIKDSVFLGKDWVLLVQDRVWERIQCYVRGHKSVRSLQMAWCVCGKLQESTNLECRLDRIQCYLRETSCDLRQEGRNDVKLKKMKEYFEWL